MAVQEVLCLTNNYSSRGGVQPIKFALHTMEGFTGPNGAMDCARYFQGDVGASSHWCIDNFHPNQAVCGVYEQYAAWTQSQYNSLSFGVEQAGYASYSRDKWLNEQGTLLHTTAALMRQICDKYGIPLRSLNASQAQDSWTAGVCDHVDFGSGGGGHHDCGSGYPMDKVIEWAKSGTGGGTTPESGDSFVSSAVAFYEGKRIIAYINTSGQICVNGGAIAGSNARSGPGLEVDQSNGRKVITYTNTSGKLCTYTQDPGSGDWAWYDTGWTAK
jgi:hypothetical protein